MAQEIAAIFPEAVLRDSDGHFRVDHDRLGFPMQTWEEWGAAGSRCSPFTHSSCWQQVG
jgi:hypothetical protein